MVEGNLGSEATQVTPLKDIYPSFFLVESRAEELWKVVGRRVTFDTASTWTKGILSLVSSMENPPVKELLTPERAKLVYMGIVDLYLTASKRLSKGKTPDYYWPVTWKENEQDPNPQEISEIMRFWIENPENVKTERACNDLVKLREVRLQAERHHTTWEQIKKRFGETEANRNTLLENAYPSFFSVQYGAEELWKKIPRFATFDVAEEQAEEIFFVMSEMKKFHAEILLTPKTTSLIRKRIIDLYMTASTRLSTEKTPDYYWPVTWEENERETQKISEIMRFWIENPENVKIERACNDLRELMEAGLQAKLHHILWKETKRHFVKKDEYLVGRGREEKLRFGPDWGRRAKGRF